MSYLKNDLFQSFSRQFLENWKIEQRTCKCRTMLIGFGIIAIIVIIVLTAEIVSSKNDSTQKCIKDGNSMMIQNTNSSSTSSSSNDKNVIDILTNKNDSVSSSTIMAKVTSSTQPYIDKTNFTSTSNDAVDAQKNQIKTSVQIINESKIRNKGKYQYQYQSCYLYSV